MKARSTIVLLFIVAITACNQPHKDSKPQQETPKALEDKGVSLEIVSKRSYDDLVESLYAELAEKKSELKKIEDGIADLRKSQVDSSASFDNYDAKNKSYFHAANNHVNQIRDSVLREKLKIMIAGSFAKYNRSVIPHNHLLKYIEERNIALNDLHTILKITRTLPLIEKYQATNLPDTNSLKGFSTQLDETVKQISNISIQ